MERRITLPEEEEPAEDEEPVDVNIVESAGPLTVESDVDNPFVVALDNPEMIHPPDARILAATRQNNINRLWEYTQAFLAVTLTVASIFSALISTTPESETLKNALFVVIGFYFGRTNHSRPTPTDPEGAGLSPYRQKEVT